MPGAELAPSLRRVRWQVPRPLELEPARVALADPTAVPTEHRNRLLAAAWALRIQPSEPGWIDLAFEAPLISAERARRELEWVPRFDTEQTLLELLEGLRAGAGLDTPRLQSIA